MEKAFLSLLVVKLVGVYMVWLALVTLTGCQAPIVVVRSDALAPAFHRRDLVFLYKPKWPEAPVGAGDLVVFTLEGRNVPILHRVVKLHRRTSGEAELLTKGDRNIVDDRSLYAPGQLWLNERDIIGRVGVVVPYVATVVIVLEEHPALVFAVLLIALLRDMY